MLKTFLTEEYRVQTLNILYLHNQLADDIHKPFDLYRGEDNEVCGGGDAE